MKEIPLTQGKIALVDDDVYADVSQFKWCAHKDRNTYYALRRHGLKNESLHRRILDVPTGIQVDHIDGNGLNNCRSNLRLATPSQNQMNRSAPRNNVSGYKGVSTDYRRKGFVSMINIHGRNVRLGCFVSAEDAARSYNEAALKYHGEFARTNMIPAEQPERRLPSLQ